MGKRDKRLENERPEGNIDLLHIKLDVVSIHNFSLSVRYEKSLLSIIVFVFFFISLSNLRSGGTPIQNSIFKMLEVRNQSQNEVL